MNERIYFYFSHCIKFRSRYPAPLTLTARRVTEREIGCRGWCCIVYFMRLHQTLGLFVAPVLANHVGFGPLHIESLKNETRSMFYHGWDNYMTHAFPADELRPLSCMGLTADPSSPDNIHLNDVLGGYHVTLVDSLDMFAIMGERDQFAKYVQLAIETVDFNQSTTVQVFETTIRGMGGLLSAHLYASVPRLGMALPNYNGELLELAYDLGQRLLPAFTTASGIPHPRVNLQKGVVPINGKKITETCSSGAGSLLLEFGLLSRLTGDSRFEEVARKAFLQLWSRRSFIDLVGMSVDAESGYWQSKITGIGASIDSYYEYAFKYYVLFGDNNFYRIFHSMYKNLLHYSFDGWFFHNINFFTGDGVTNWIDSLAAFFPGLQTLAGDLTAAVKHHLVYYKLWKTYGGIPERWEFTDTNSVDAIALEWYPLRPEFVESNYYLHQATNDPFYLEVGRQAVNDLRAINEVECGFAGTQDMRNGMLTDRMESFFLSETTKYLYLLFDETNPLNKEYSNFVFSTEAHPLWYDNDVVKYASAKRFRLAVPLEDHHKESNTEMDQGDFSIAGWIRSKLYDPSKNFAQPMKPMKKPHEDKLVTETCDVWPSRNRWYSTIASWPEFYALDSAYNFTSPGWVTSARANGNNSSAWGSFADRYVWENGFCAIPQLQVFELSFGKTPLHPTDKPQRDPNNPGVIQIKNLNGKQLRILRKPSFNGYDTYSVIAVDGLTVEERLEVDDFLELSQSGFISIREKVLYLQESPVVNVRFSSLHEYT